MMDEAHSKEFHSLSFGVYTPGEIRKLSVVELTNIETFDEQQKPTDGGVYDRRMGCIENDEDCKTCSLPSCYCPGHNGHIELPLPVFNPVVIKTLFQLLQGMCLSCNKLLVGEIPKKLALYQLQALDYGLLQTVYDLAESVTASSVTGEQDVVCAIEHNFKHILEEATKGLGFQKSQLTPRVRMVVDCRQSIVKRFIKQHLTRSVKKCPHCSNRNIKLVLEANTQIQFATDDNSAEIHQGKVQKRKLNRRSLCESKGLKVILTPAEAKQYVNLLWKNEKLFLQHLFRVLHIPESSSGCPVDIFFTEALLVPPPKFRPFTEVKGKKYPHLQSALLREVLSDCILLRNIIRATNGDELSKTEQAAVNEIRGNSSEERVKYMWEQLQTHVSCVYDSNADKLKNSKVSLGKKQVPPGIKQVLEKKEGLFRSHIMGKRVNYAARSVISPDPYIMVDEIGVSEVFARELTYPSRVTHWNAEKLREAVINGPDVYPGAKKVEYADGRIVYLNTQDYFERRNIGHKLSSVHSVTKHHKENIPVVVHRDLQDGDLLLINRQPTLHKPSIMAHRARILPGEKTLRLHYANCNAYNADFDGDEMNAHFPQCEMSRSECFNLASVNHQYLVPKDGTPLSGLIQDHIIAATLLTLRDTFFHRESYYQLVFSAVPSITKAIKTLPPCIMKPKELWSGKQVVSTVVINVLPVGKPLPNIEQKAKISEKNWQTIPPRKWLAGGTPLVGDEMSESDVIIHSGELLSGVLDKANVGPTPYGLIHCCFELYGGEISSALLSAFGRLFTQFLQTHTAFTLGVDDLLLTSNADKKRKKILSQARRSGDSVMAEAFGLDDRDNKVSLNGKYKDAHRSGDDVILKNLDFQMKKMTEKCNKEINSVCMPFGLLKKFPHNNFQLMVQTGAKGKMINAIQISCLLGQIELEGNRVPLMLSGHSLPSFKPYSSSPRAGGFVAGRFLMGIPLQGYFFHCMAGREGIVDTAIKTSNSGYLQRCLVKHLEGITVNYDLTVRDSDGSVIQFLYGEDGLDVPKMQLLKENHLDILRRNYNIIISNSKKEVMQYDPALLLQKEKISRWKIQSNLESVKSPDPDPVTSIFRPDITFGSVSEKLDSIIEDYIRKCDQERFAGDVTLSNNLRKMYYYHALRSIVEPGEGVGMLAAQSIGEPSTQMTLNTFHFAGRGETNVTLGIPRLREILMFASENIATPSMELPLQHARDMEKKAEKLKVKLSLVTLEQVLESVEIKESLYVKRKSPHHKRCIIKLNFLPLEAYEGLLHVTPLSIMDYIERTFISQIIAAVAKNLKDISQAKLISSSKTRSFSPVPVKEVDESEASVSNFSADDSTLDMSTDTSKLNSSFSCEYDEQENVYHADGYDEHDVYEHPNETSNLESEVSDQDCSFEDENLHDDVNFTYSGNKKRQVDAEEKVQRIKNVIDKHSWVSKYDFDAEKLLWCKFTLQLPFEASTLDMLFLVENEIKKAIVYQVPKIKKAFVIPSTDSPDSVKIIKTEGVNFPVIFGADYANLIDTKKVYSNDIHSISKVFGIEAARVAIVKEIKNVFTTYGIQVDPRHLLLIADYMTYDGSFKPCNRFSMANNPSILQQMSFETTMNFLQSSILNASEEQLKSPSARLCVGKPVAVGTGCFDILLAPP